jgi:hypothetical protein
MRPGRIRRTSGHRRPSYTRCILGEASRLSGGSEAPLPVMPIPHDRADLRLVASGAEPGLPAIDALHLGPPRSRSWPGLAASSAGTASGCCSRACSPLAEPAETSLVASGPLRSHDLLRQPVLVVCGRALWLVGPWLDYLRTRHQKSPLLTAPVLGGRRTGGDANVCSGHETMALGAGTGGSLPGGPAGGSNGVQRQRNRSQCPSSHSYAAQTF